MIDMSPDEFRRLGYRAVDLLADDLASLHDRPCRFDVVTIDGSGANAVLTVYRGAFAAV